MPIAAERAVNGGGYDAERPEDSRVVTVNARSDVHRRGTSEGTPANHISQLL